MKEQKTTLEDSLYQAQLLRYAADLARVYQRERDEHRQRTRADALFRILFNSASEGILILDTDGVIVDLNRSFSRMTATETQNLRGEYIARLKGFENLLSVLTPSADNIGETVLLELVLPGCTQTLSIRASSLHDDTGRSFGWLCFLTDATDIQMPHGTKKEFLSIVSHELRTPLTSIKGYAALLEDSSPDLLDDRQRSMVQDICASAGELQQAIDEIITYTAVGTSEVLTTECTDIDELARRSMAAVRKAAEAKDIVMSYTFDGESCRLDLDPVLIGCALEQLLKNAVVYNINGGSVRFAVSSDSSEVRFSVEDTGRGIRPENMMRVFESFFRAEESLRMTTRGLGLGLSLAQRIAHLHGGEIRAFSSVDRGSRFILVLPQQSHRK